VLALARAAQLICYTLSIDYGQRHRHELIAAQRIARELGAIEHRVVTVDFGQFGGSALTDPGLAIPRSPSEGIPVTYVPARNTVFLALALGWAEVIGAREIHIGANAVDYSGYPDCRPAFIEQFERLAAVATKAGIDGVGPRIVAPLMDLGKAEIIAHGLALGVDYAATVSCYAVDDRGRACGECDACALRRAGFERAGVADPTRYRDR
jgi:7-cyano-7-deazaguanine synthase